MSCNILMLNLQIFLMLPMHSWSKRSEEKYVKFMLAIVFRIVVTFAIIRFEYVKVNFLDFRSLIVFSLFF